jgi:hypothetical protein
LFSGFSERHCLIERERVTMVLVTGNQDARSPLVQGSHPELGLSFCKQLVQQLWCRDNYFARLESLILHVKVIPCLRLER